MSDELRLTFARELCGHTVVVDKATDASVECCLPAGHDEQHDYSALTGVEVTNDAAMRIADAWARGFNPEPCMQGSLVRDLLRARGICVLLCSLCGKNILTLGEHTCDQTWRSRDERSERG